MVVLAIGCSESMAPAVRKPHQTPTQGSMSIGGLRPGMPLDDARRLKAGLLAQADWAFAESHEHSAWTVSDDPAIVTFSIDDGKVTMVYGLEMQIGDVLLRHGDPLGRVLDLIGPPERVLDNDKSPDRTLTYNYPALALSVAVDREQRRVNGGFTLTTLPK